MECCVFVGGLSGLPRRETGANDGSGGQLGPVFTMMLEEIMIYSDESPAAIICIIQRRAMSASVSGCSEKKQMKGRENQHGASKLNFSVLFIVFFFH